MRLTTRIAMPLGLAIALVALPATAHAYDRPTGTYCTTSGACYETRATDEYAQSIYVKSHSADSGWGNLETHTGRYYVSNVPGCVYAYRSPEQWAQAGSPRASNICVKGYLVEVITHTFTRWRFPDIPESAKTRGPLAPERLSIAEWRVAGQRPVDYPDIVHPSIEPGSTLEFYCATFSTQREELPDDYTGSIRVVAKNDTPDSVMQPCGFTMRLADVRTPTSNQPSGGGDAIYSDQPVGRVAAIAIPAAATACAAVRGRPGVVDVRSLGAACAGARLVIARYARALKQPRGWRCHVATSQRRVRCVRVAAGRAASTRARAVVYGKWGGRR